MCVVCVCTSLPSSPEEDIGFPGSRVTEACDCHVEVCELLLVPGTEPVPFTRQPMLLAAQLLIQPLKAEPVNQLAESLR